MVNKTVYLAGPIDGMSFAEGNGWRERAIKKLGGFGIKALSPQRGKNYVAADPEVAEVMDFAKQEMVLSVHPMSTSSMIFTRDKFDALNCDVLLVNFQGAQRRSIGTAMEIAWAYQQGKPIIVIVDESDQLHSVHPMLRQTFSHVTTSLEEGINIVASIFQGY